MESKLGRPKYLDKHGQVLGVHVRVGVEVLPVDGRDGDGVDVTTLGIWSAQVVPVGSDQVSVMTMNYGMSIGFF